MVGDLDLLVAGGSVVTMDEERRLLPLGWVAAAGNRIVGPDRRPRESRSCGSPRAFLRLGTVGTRR